MANNVYNTEINEKKKYLDMKIIYRKKKGGKAVSKVKMSLERTIYSKLGDKGALVVPKKSSKLTNTPCA
jgi:hypothetical protein